MKEQSDLEFILMSSFVGIITIPIVFGFVYIFALLADIAF